MLDTRVLANALGLPFNKIDQGTTSPTRTVQKSSRAKPATRHRKKAFHHTLPAARIVIFRRDLEDLSRVTAVFPCEPAFGDQMLGFTQAEGDMTCSRFWFDMSEPAKEDHYADLAAYLRAQGHTLDIRHRITPAMDRTRDWNAEWQRVQEDKYIRRSRQDSAALEELREAISIVAEASGICALHLADNTRTAPCAQRARWAAMALARRHFGLDHSTIAEALGRTVTGVKDTIRRAERTRHADPLLGPVLDRAEELAWVYAPRAVAA